ncbi:MAG: DUF1729 domain-containing protein, partial [Myxococcales bacterium]|nr:DUF1729 domain-containing protein [Myxococcales bacterium]
VTLFAHVEGGKAGGHHSWEDLDQLLLDGYAKLRQPRNLVLCVGGGIADEARAVELLTGTWARRYAMPDMPVDAVFLGTLAMACREATASDSVKQALVGAGGTRNWVHAGDAHGGVTSGRSQLGADIHYLDNAAARAGRLLDSVAGDADAVLARKDEIVAALARTAKPWFGDFESMSWLAIVQRAVELLATGRGGRYEDGAWPDVTFRERAQALVQRAEQRLYLGPDAVPTIVGDRADLDDPQDAVARFAARWPTAAQQRPHPADLRWFVDLCGRPGKPVSFVPVLDADVRRWYKADSLWQAQDPRHAADAVLVIPGPEAVAGIRCADEPVADLLARFEAAVVEHLERAGTAVEGEAAPGAGAALPTPWPLGVVAQATPTGTQLRADGGAAATEWLEAVAARFAGPVAAACGDVAVVTGGRRIASPVRRLCRAEPGAVLHLDHDEGAVLAALSWQGPTGEVVRLERSAGHDQTLELVVTCARALGRPRLVLPLRHRTLERGAFVLEIDAAARADAVQALYLAAIASGSAEPVALFEAAHDRQELPLDRSAAYAALAGATPGGGTVPADLAFSLALPAMFRVLACPELRGGWLDLLHAAHGLEVVDVRGLGRAAEIEARAVRVDDSEAGRAVTVRSVLACEGTVRVVLTSRLLLRGPHAALPSEAAFGRTARHAVVGRAHEPFVASVALGDAAARTFLLGHRWLTLLDGRDVGVGDVLHLDADVIEQRGVDGRWLVSASGRVLRHGVPVGSIHLPATAGTGPHHPLRVLADLLPVPGAAPVPTPRRTLGHLDLPAPADATGFADVSGDRNPIHTSPAAARLAGLEAPIVHGMWTAANLHHFAAVAAGSADGRFVRASADFLAPVPLGARLRFDVVRTGVRRGVRSVEATATVVDGADSSVVARSRIDVAPPRTAYIFPGQGIQQQGMGMDGHARSRAARAVWERADTFTRGHLGFSLLHVVRANPRRLGAGFDTHVHPEGVLHLTQFTQVAMAVLAVAQVAELREAGVLVEGAVTCGHSVGEYDALAAYVGVLPLESVIDIVWMRGCTMHTVVERDAAGRSPYRMGVVRPNLAGLDHAGAEALVADVAAVSGRFVQIVNHNVCDRQYSVTGHVDALAVLERELTRRQPKGGKPAWVTVPGIDVPFHSDVLRSAVPAFRRVLDERLPATMDAERLVGRYIPNLVARPFSLDASFVSAVHQASGSEALAAVLRDVAGWQARPDELARLLLVELLAWQFASPVRWIETQDVLFARQSDGGLGIERCIEVGVGHQPTLTNMARATLDVAGPAAPRVTLLNAEAHLDVVLEQDSDPDSPQATHAATVATLQPTGPAPLPAVAPAPVVAAPPARPGQAANQPAPSRPASAADALVALLALQARFRPEQVRDTETIDEVFEGVSSRRNQALLDLGAEFGVGAIDGAHDKPLPGLVAELQRRNPSWRAPGKYLRAAIDDACKRVLGRAGLGRKDLVAHLEAAFGLDEPTADAVLIAFATATRPGDSARGGALATVEAAGVADRAAGLALVESVAGAWAQRVGVGLARRGAAIVSGGTVDAGAVRDLAEHILGRDGVLVQAARALTSQLGHGPTPASDPDPADAALRADAELLRAELGPEFARLVQPSFDARKHVAFASAWATAQRDVARLFHDAQRGRLAPEAAREEAARLQAFHAEPRVRDAVAWFARRADVAGNRDLASELRRIAARGPGAPVSVVQMAPVTTVLADGRLDVNETPRTGPVRSQADATLGDFRGATALVTGASPGSIALEVVRHLLRGGARVVLTTSTYNAARLRTYRRFWQRNAGPDAELHLVPFNQASAQDIDALLGWLHGPVGLAPDLCLPFAALKDLGTLDGLGPRAEAALRAMLIGVEKIVAGIGRQRATRAELAGRCHVVLPLSPNHGQFGGDGVYAETKAGLETLTHRWHSEQANWGRGVGLVLARIGWVRGTGLMDANDAVAARLEAATGVRTFSAAEMGALLAEACGPASRTAAAEQPQPLDLTGGFGALADVKGTVDGLRRALDSEVAAARALAGLRRAEAARLGTDATEVVALRALPTWPTPALPAPNGLPSMPLGPTPLERMVVIVGLGELGPCGSLRTRWELETADQLSPAAAAELAWLTGLARYEAGRGWLDTATGEPVADADLATRYETDIRRRTGLRRVDPKTAGFDPAALQTWVSTFLDRDVTFTVGAEADARACQAADPQWTRIEPASDGWRVTRTKGAEVRVPKVLALSRQVAGTLPDGIDWARLGVPRDMIGSTDPSALMDLVATADAFAMAGLDPEALLAHVHPARVGNTQGSGIGGMKSLHRLYLDPVLGRERQTDALQETLINVMGAYAVQAYVGSYGTMSHPVGACATAAASIESACDKLLCGRADFIVAGGFDDYGPEGAVGFQDMNATASSDDMLAMGLEPAQMSRPNDLRRKGFVEGQGGGTALLTRGDVALRLGLPVHGVVAYAGSFADGVHRSIPAPGQGVLAVAQGGMASPLGQALAAYGLTADDIAVVSKHDTSTGANDPNESRLHDRIQRALGRSAGNPLHVVSQKSLTGHAKGGAAAWQLAGLCQTLATGTIPGNRNLDSVDPALRSHSHLCWSDTTIETGGPLRAGVLTSLGFGHVGAIVLVLHPDAFRASLAEADRSEWDRRATLRSEAGRRRMARVLMGETPLYERRTHRRFRAADGSDAQQDEEAALLLDGSARLQADGRYGSGRPAGHGSESAPQSGGTAPGGAS